MRLAMSAATAAPLACALVACLCSRSNPRSIRASSDGAISACTSTSCFCFRRNTGKGCSFAALALVTRGCRQLVELRLGQVELLSSHVVCGEGSQSKGRAVSELHGLGGQRRRAALLLHLTFDLLHGAKEGAVQVEVVAVAEVTAIRALDICPSTAVTGDVVYRSPSELEEDSGRVHRDEWGEAEPSSRAHTHTHT